MSSLAPSLQHTITTKLIVFLGALSALAAISTDIYLPALSSITDTLGASNSEAQLTLGIFFMGYGFGQLLFGPLSDSIGRRPVLLIGLYIYTAASIACALSTHMDFLILSRLLQALGGCAAAVTSRAIVRDSSEGEQTTRALTGIMAVIQIAPLVAPIVGAVILLFWPWQGIFVALSVYGVISIICAHLWIKESHPKSKRQTLHPKNIALGYIETLGNINISLLLIAEVATSLCLITFVTGSSLLFSRYYGLSPQSFGMLFAFMASSLLSGSFISSRLLPLKGVKWLISAFLFIGLISAACLLTVALLMPEKILLVIAGIWLCLLPCIALRASYTSLGLQYIPERAGIVSALFGAFSLGLGGVIAVVIGRFDNFTPAIMASMILAGFISSTMFYTIWRFQKKHH